MHVKLLLSENIGTDGRIIKLDFKETASSKGLMAGCLKIILNPGLVICQQFEQILSFEELHSMGSGRLSLMIISY